MQKFNGVGVWDYEYPGDDGSGGVDNEKRYASTNWDKDGGGKILDDAGNDATNDKASNYALDSSVTNCLLMMR